MKKRNSTELGFLGVLYEAGASKEPLAPGEIAKKDQAMEAVIQELGLPDDTDKLLGGLGLSLAEPKQSSDHADDKEEK